ncbi:unnamed protein product [Albugo candida]|uniref:Uncharacterized protein n=1 Tax=Albugo candida TaxID=65357 RepID=A0A024GBK9_9STRA|nr:unnamed protein product [Albugo candida]|eukprot:CCI43727.1 unnamed protein product [Albugo candida]
MAADDMRKPMRLCSLVVAVAWCKSSNEQRCRNTKCSTFRFDFIAVQSLRGCIVSSTTCVLLATFLMRKRICIKKHPKQNVHFPDEISIKTFCIKVLL